jgi:hypothetical protein
MSGEIPRGTRLASEGMVLPQHCLHGGNDDMHQYAKRRSNRRRRIRPITFVLFASAALALTFALQPRAGGQNGTTSPGTKQPPIQQANAMEHPMDRPLAMIYEAKRAFADVKDYTCTLQSRENIKGVLQDENVMTVKMRTQPFSIYMRWVAPQKNQGQEVCFVMGKNNNKMRVRSNVLGAKLTFVSIDPNDNRVKEHSRHTIYEAGMGHLIEQTVKHWEFEKQVSKTQVKMAPFVYNNRRCTRIETIRAERVQGFYCYRSVIYLDEETKLPVRTECYDWPREGGPPDGELLEMFSYIDMRVNVGLTDQDFNK